jgi:MOSC domain-containing protein YiiM
MKKSVGEVLDIFINSKNRENVSNCDMDNKGIVNDKHYAKDLNRSILLTSIYSYDLAKNSQISMDIGLLGENILIDYNPYDLKEKDKIQIGEVVVEVTQKCTMCEHLSSIDKKLPKLLKNDRGIFVKVIQKGSIKIGDKLYLV